MRHAVWMLLTSGCFLFGGPVDEDRFPTLLGDTLCHRLKECDRGEFEADYFDGKDCRLTQKRSITELVEIRAESGCKFDEDEARTAVKDIASMDCDQFYEAVYVDGSFKELQSVWSGCGGGS
ncbi:MAG: hypothetical protein ACI8PZ_000349 [Myxococcota bacterium]|jgi:hypothetical protein